MKSGICIEGNNLHCSMNILLKSQLPEVIKIDLSSLFV